MTIDSLNQRLIQPGVNLDQVLGQGANGSIKLTEPLNPPSNWTKFKAALSNVPLLGQLGSLQQARAERDSYPVRLGQYQAGNRQILAGLASDMRAKYGDHIANMAMRDLNHADGAPLTGRAVSALLQGADKAQASYRSWNNQLVTRFLENGLTGGGRGRGETDMIGICLERGMKLDGQNTWQGMVSPNAARFLEHQVREHCKALPEYAQGHLGNEQIAQAAEKALDVYDELLSAPGMTPAKLDEYLAGVPGSKFKEGGQAVANAVREQIIMGSIEGPMNRRDPESMLCSVAREVTGRLGRPDLPDAVLKSISGNMVEGLRYRATGLHKELGCGSDAQSIVQALRPRLEEQVRRAVEEHCEALRLIDASPTLSDDAKAGLREIANTRRIDPVQVQAYQDVAQAMGGVGDGLRQSNPGACVESLKQALSAFENGLERMKMHGHGMWESNSLSGGDFTYDMLDQMARVAAQSQTQAEAEALLALLTGPEGAQMVAALALSGDMKLSMQCPMLYHALVEAVAVQAGRSAETARGIVDSLGDTPKPTLDQLPAQLARIVVGSEPEIDGRGVVDGSRNGKLVSREFDPRQVIDSQRQEISDWVQRDAPGSRPWLSKTMEVDVGRAVYFMQGERIGDTGGAAGPTLERFRASFPEGPDGDAMALAVSRCANQIGINTFFEVNNQAAFPGQIGSFIGGKTTHEAWRNEDGSWSVRSTHASRPNAFVSAEQGGEIQEVQGSGVALYTLTYRIQPPAQPGGQPVTSIVDSQVVYNI